MLLRMGGSAGDHLGQPAQGVGCHRIEANLSQRRGHRIDPGQRQPPNRDAVHRPQQHHATNGLPPRGEQRIGLRGGGAGVDIPGMGNDQRFGWLRSGCSRRTGFKQTLDGPRQRQGLAGVESAGNGGGTNLMHDHLLSR